jgi:hypothetical protein
MPMELRLIFDALTAWTLSARRRRAERDADPRRIRNGLQAVTLASTGRRASASVSRVKNPGQFGVRVAHSWRVG